MPPRRSRMRAPVACLSLLLLVLALITPSQAYTETITTDGNPQCWGMYGPSAVPGQSKMGTISPDFSGRPQDYYKNKAFALLVFDYESDTVATQICDGNAIATGKCTDGDRGKWVIDTKTTAPYLNAFVNVSALPPTLAFEVPKTGFYCVVAYPTGTDVAPYDVDFKVANPYGLLPAADFPKLPFYGVLSIVYLLVGVAWMVVSFINWRDLLPVQHYISGVIIFLTTEMAFNYGFFEDYNHWGRGSKALLVFCVVLNAARNSVSFFMLLIVSLGYGVVRPTLGSTMKKCLYLTYVHFVCGVVYAASSLLVTDISIWVLLFCVMPLSTSMTVFYFWILNAITQSMNHLQNRRQPVKLQMYRRLWGLLVASVVVIVFMFVVDAFFFMNRDSPDWLPKHWRVRWFLLDGWLNILYLLVFLGICILWRPTENNQRYGLDELAQDDHDDDNFRATGQSHTAGQQINLRKVVVVNDDGEDVGLDDEAGDLGSMEDFGHGHDGEDEHWDGRGGGDDDDEDVMNWAEANVGRARSASPDRRRPQTPIDEKMR
ncbi:lung seven transmembrane receptor-domain-containing protein [Powellomyces hirtus]|nr:lung seven transmembrane receptor-domain-containing protein [Powellomyces hirtus]